MAFEKGRSGLQSDHFDGQRTSYVDDLGSAIPRQVDLRSARGFVRRNRRNISAQLGIDTFENIEYAKRVHDALRSGAQQHGRRSQGCASDAQSHRLRFRLESGFAIESAEVTLGPALFATDLRFFGHDQSRLSDVKTIPESLVDGLPGRTRQWLSRCFRPCQKTHQNSEDHRNRRLKARTKSLVRRVVIRLFVKERTAACTATALRFLVGFHKQNQKGEEHVV